MTRRSGQSPMAGCGDSRALVQLGDLPPIIIDKQEQVGYDFLDLMISSSVYFCILCVPCVYIHIIMVLMHQVSRVSDVALARCPGDTRQRQRLCTSWGRPSWNQELLGYKM